MEDPSQSKELVAIEPRKRGRKYGTPQRKEGPRTLVSPKDVRSLARSHTESAIHTLAKIMTHPDAQASARVAAASELLNRGWGKATQPVDGDGEGGPIVFRWLMAGEGS